MQKKDIVVFPWSHNFDTGIELIDSQHKELVSILNQLANTIVYDNKVEVDSVFEKLAAYAEYHFSEEERIWKEYFLEGNWLDSHQETHASFLPKIMEIKKNASHLTWQETTEQIVQFLIRWLAFHILHDDKRMSFVVHEMIEGKSFGESQSLAEANMSATIRVLIDTVLSMYDELSSHAIELIKERNQRIRVEEELRLLNEKLEKLSITDELSGLFNRRHFNNVISMEIQRAIREKALVSFICMDLDHFKSLNDRLGHTKGDEAIVEVSMTISKLCRRAGDFSFRMGGEEFLVVVYGSSILEIQNLAERIRISIENIVISCDDTGLSHDLTTSVGVFSHVPQVGDNSEFYSEMVDSALYEAKNRGRNVVVSVNNIDPPILPI
nr:GGDEF domain-containing protein [uncultured Vibrio sp.]